MTLDRRRFLGTLPTISLGLAAGQARAQYGSAAGERLLAGLERTAGFTVQRVVDGSNLAGLAIAPHRLDGLEERLRAANVRIGKVQDGKVQLGFNESILRRDTAYLLKAFGQP
ncbi:hypothetical protein [uncultured Massilia sp.]|uniref:hypothetical protein n=1 Tax=uncultured Massilia sp. TaxID=169973 RepID=UPI0025FA6299|nr:hypothetical protein [uncultured Massilia sp.]